MTDRTRDHIWRLINCGDYRQAGDYIARHVTPGELAEAITYALQALERAIVGPPATDEEEESA